MHLAVLAAVTVVTAVITGALVVGDSVRGSLRDLTLQRLGRIDQAVMAPHLFRAKLAEDLKRRMSYKREFPDVEPALLLRGSATRRVEQQTRRASELNLIGVTDNFWSLGRTDPRSDPQAEGVWITQQVANDLGATAGDEIVLQLPLMSAVPADSPLGEKVDTIAGQSYKVAGVLPDRGLARFGLQPSQQPPRSVFVPLDQLAQAIDQPDKANVLLVASAQVDRATDDKATEWLTTIYQPTLADYGLSVLQHNDYLQLSAEGLVLPPKVVESANKAFAEDPPQPLVSYLANTLEVGDRKIPYSTVTGVDSQSLIGPVTDNNGVPITLADDEIALNRWAADKLQAKLGDTVTLRYYEPEGTHGNLQEAEPLTLKLAAIVELKTPSGEPTLAADPDLTPQLAGVTDRDSIADWDLPFELVEPISQDDEDYWDEYRTTPKAFVSYAVAAEKWQTRWGTVSLLRVPMSGQTSEASFEEKLLAALDPNDLGMAMQPVKAQGLKAASGTTPFDGLFLGFSMFLIASAIMLLVLLFRLGMEQRAHEVGLLTAVGFAPRRIVLLLIVEALAVALAGATIGSLCGVFYAWCMVAGLKTLWVDAIVTPFLEVHVGPWSLPIGLLLGFATAAFTTWRTIRSVLRHSPRGLLAGSLEDETPVATNKKTRRPWPWPAILLVMAVGLVAWGLGQVGDAQGGALMGAGTLLVASALIAQHRRWKRQSRARTKASGLSLMRLALTNMSRRPGRSTLTMGLVAAASYQLLAVSAFRLSPSEQGTGGYDWYATSDAPIHYDLGAEQGQFELGFQDSTIDRLQGCTIDSLRVHGGEDASCLNLYRTTQPRVLGIRQPGEVLSQFAWAKTRWATGATPALDLDLGTDAEDRPVVPVVLDLATAMYSLHLSGSVGDRWTIQDANDQPVTLEVVGLLQNSILQGDLMVSDANFRRLFPADSGSQLFLIRDKTPSPAAADSSLGTLLESQLTDFGFDAADARERLASYLAVQNTYLSTFQALGGLGLLLGTVGLAVVQLRNVLERRGELALMQAVGFRRRRLVWLVLLENLALVAGGLLLGGLCAGIALLPQMSGFETSVPWQTALVMMAAVMSAGLISTWLATRGTLKQALLPALRGD